MSKQERTPENQSVIDDAEVRDAIRSAEGDPQEAVRRLLAALAEAKAAYLAMTSLGYRRGRQPTRRLL